METNRVILAKFVDFDVTQTNMLPWQPDVRFSEKILFLLKNYWKIVSSNYLPQFYIFYHFLSK